MTRSTLIFRSLRFHARSHSGTLLGAAIGTAVLVGALVVGDSVRQSLRDMAMLRLGRIELALASNDRFFRAELSSALEDPLDAPAAAALVVAGTASNQERTARANRVQVLGVDESFWNFSLDPISFAPPKRGEVVLNETLAQQLRAKPGESVLLRMEKPSQLSRDAPMSPEEDASLALRVTVSAVVPERQFGRFSLQANQVPPFNAFVDRDWLGEQLDLAGRANLMLIAPGTNATAPLAQVFLRRAWGLADAELELRPLPDGSGLELRSPRVFIDAPVSAAGRAAASHTAGVLTYFVNEIRRGDQAAPYSMITATDAPWLPSDLRTDEILIHPWLAEDLNAKPGDKLSIAYFVVGAMRTLEERTNTFTVRALVMTNGPAGDRTLMPDFPGLKDAKNCREWDTGLPIDMTRIREKDNQYWEHHQGTPKAFVSLAAGQKLWSNRFGNLTAVRFYENSARATGATSAVKETGALEKFRGEVERELLARLEPAAVGLRFEPVRAQALAAAEQSQDFGGLFLGFSFFLIVAALLLMALLFQFGIEQRAGEIGTLLALGFTPRQVRLGLLGEGAVLALIAGALGSFAGMFYAKAMLHALTTVWRSAVGTSSLQFHAHPSTLMIGALAGAIVAVFTIAWALRRQARQPARELLAQGGEETVWPAQTVTTTRTRLAAVSCLVIGVSLAALALARGDSNAAGLFFGAGALLLLAGLFSTAAGFRIAARRAALLSQANSNSNSNVTSLGVSRFTIAELGARNVARRPKRSLATVALLACGSFLIVSIGAFRLDAERDATRRSSGTGGFVFIGETSHPVVHDLNTEKGRDAFSLDAKKLSDTKFVPMRVRDGDDASCLNLNRAQKPRLLGVKPELLAERNAFTFVNFASKQPLENPWLLLNEIDSTGAVPAIGDAASIQWALGKKVGDTLVYTDERGGEFRIRLVGAVANSILQGNLLIAEHRFVERFPNETGYRMFLIDGPSNDPVRRDEMAATLMRGLQDVGLELTPAAARLAAFNAVQNTYLNTFQVLGGLGLVLGSFGLAIVVLRNVLERRSELAVLLALGFQPRQVKWMVISEHGKLLLLGLAVGVFAALVAVLPTLLTPGQALPWRSLGVTLLAVLVNGAVWTWVAASLALRGKLLNALRNE